MHVIWLNRATLLCIHVSKRIHDKYRQFYLNNYEEQSYSLMNLPSQDGEPTNILMKISLATVCYLEEFRRIILSHQEGLL